MKAISTIILRSVFVLCLVAGAIGAQAQLVNQFWGTGGGNDSLAGVGGLAGNIISLDTAGNMQTRHAFTVTAISGVPYGDLLLYNGKYYGMASVGINPHQNGCIFSYDTATGIYTDLHDFAAGANDGSIPKGSLIVYNNVLYGRTLNGGTGLLANSDGYIFSYNLTTNTYATIHKLTGADGKQPYYGAMVVFNSMLYGTTESGGTGSTAGVIFSVNPTTNVYADIYNFPSAGTTGKNPYSSLVVYNNLLYGMAEAGGSAGDGVIFSFNPTGNVYTDVHDFDGLHGASGYGSLVVYNNLLYGMTHGGGANGIGAMFSLDPSNNTYTDIYDFNATNGQNPYGSLLVAGTKLYGMANLGGANSEGVIFSFNTTTNTYADIYNFSTGIDQGALPYGSLVLNNNKLWGMTSAGGGVLDVNTINKGVIFSYDTLTNKYSAPLAFEEHAGYIVNGSLALNNNILYGTTEAGGIDGGGVIYSMTPAYPDSFNIVYNFNAVSGYYPYTDVVTYGNKLWGTTGKGGDSTAGGTLFSYNPASNVFTKLYSFGTVKGGAPFSDLCPYNGKLYGISEIGGASNNGVIFSFDTAANVYTDLYDIPTALAIYNPEPSTYFTAYNNKLYAMTEEGGANGDGMIFSFDPATNAFTDVHDFDGLTGGPANYGSFYADTITHKLYGSAANGPYSRGVFFSFDPATATYTDMHDFGSFTGDLFNTGTTPIEFNGRFWAATANGGNPGDGGIIRMDTNGANYTVVQNWNQNGPPNNRLTVVPIVCIGAPAAGTISNNHNSFCGSGNDTLTLIGETISYAITYQWQSSADGINWANVGTNAATFKGAITATTYYRSIVACTASGLQDTTSVDTVTIIPNVTPTVSIAAGGGSTICAGAPVTFTATTTNSGATPSYQWTKNGTNVGTNSTTYTDNALNNNDAVICILTSNAVCATTNTATSNTVTMTVNPILTPSVSIGSSSGSSICTGTNVTFTATPTNGGASPSYQWTKNGNNVGTNSATYTDNGLNNNDVIGCTLTSNATCIATPTATSNTITMSVISNITPTVSIASSPVSPVCAGSNVIFTATPNGGGSNPSYQWTKNGNTVGSSTSTYTDNALNNGDVIVCVLTSDATCAAVPTATSNTLTMAVTPNVTPAVSISAGNGNTICEGASVTFTATPTNGGATPSYHWTKNGNTVGTTNATYTDNALINNDVIVCTITSDATCVLPATATSNIITMIVNPILVPTAGITVSPTGAICAGAPVTFTATSVNGGTTPVYQWTDDGNDISGATDATYSSTLLNNNDQIVCTLISNATCAMPDTVNSNTVTMTVNPLTLTNISMTAAPGDTICAGTPVTFTATQTGGGTAPLYQWVNSSSGPVIGATTTTYTSSSLNNNDSVVCVMVSNATCATPATAISDTIIMAVTPVAPPAVTISASPGTSVSAGQPVTFTAAVTNGGTVITYQWQNDAANIAGATQSTYTTSSLANNNVITCLVHGNAVCTDPDSAGSNQLVMNISSSGIASVAGNNNGVYIYPNPNNGTFTIQGSVDDSKEAQIEVLDVIGQVVYHATIATQNNMIDKQIQLSKENANGIYLLRITTDKGSSVLRFVMER